MRFQRPVVLFHPPHVILVVGGAYFYSQWILIEIQNTIDQAELAEQQLGTRSTKWYSEYQVEAYKRSQFGRRRGLQRQLLPVSGRSGSFDTARHQDNFFHLRLG